MNRVLGIGFSGNRIYFTELLGTADAYRAENIEQVKVDFDFEEDLGKFKSSQKDLTNISSEIITYINKHNSGFNKAGITISSSQAFTLILPVDFSEGRQSINSKIYWELSNYFPDNYNDFLINTYRLGNVLPCKNSDDFLVIAVPKNTVEFVKRIFKICSLELSVIDIDHFSAETILRQNYSGIMAGKNILLVGIKKGRIDYGIIENKRYKYFQHSRYYNNTEFNLNITRKIQSIINRPFQSKINAIFLYGDEIKEDTVETLCRLPVEEVKVLDPFDGINATEAFLKNENLRKNSYCYSSSGGIALRLLTA